MLDRRSKSTLATMIGTLLLLRASLANQAIENIVSIDDGELRWRQAIQLYAAKTPPIWKSATLPLVE